MAQAPAGAGSALVLAAVALARHGAVAGSASALLGVLQYVLGAGAAPLVGVAGADTAIPMAVLMLVLSLGAAVALRAGAEGVRGR